LVEYTILLPLSPDGVKIGRGRKLSPRSPGREAKSATGGVGAAGAEAGGVGVAGAEADGADIGAPQEARRRRQASAAIKRFIRLSSF